MTRRSRTVSPHGGVSRLRLQLKQAGAFRGGLIALGIVVLIATIAVTAWPRAVSSLLTDELQHRVSTTAPGLRDVQTSLRTQATGGVNAAGDKSSNANITAALHNHIRAMHTSFPQPLKSMLTSGDAATRSDVLATTGPVFNYHYNVQLEGYAGLADVSTLASGHWPRATDADTPTAPIQIVMSASAAKRMGWKLGEVREVPLGVPPQPRAVTLVGTVTPDAGADFWQLDPLRSHVAFENLGDGGFKMTAVVWTAPAQWQQLYTQVAASTTGWYGVDSSNLTSSTVGVLQTQLAKFLATPQPLNPFLLHFTTHLDTTLSDYVAAAGPAQTLLLLLASGPLGVAIAVLFLGVELLVERRRATLALLSARGASGVRIRGSLALETLAVSVPAAAVALAVTVAILPGPRDVLTIVLASLCAIVPPVVMAALGSSRTREQRVAARGRGFARWRWLVECVVVAAAVAALTVLITRGLTPSAGTIAADPLVVATPLLICLAASVVVLRLYPFALAAAATALRRRRGATGFLGAVRGERTSASTLVPVLAVLVGIAVTVFSSVVFTTERTGIQQDARGTVGADISVTATQLTGAQIERMRKTPGVAQLATVESAGYANLAKDGTSQPVFVMTTDTASLARLQADLPSTARTPAGMAHRVSGRAQVLLGGWDAGGNARDGVLSIGDQELRVHEASVTAVPGDFIANSPWLLLDTRVLPKGFGLHAGVTTTALVLLEPGVDAAAVQKRLSMIAGQGAVLHSAPAQADAARAAPVVGGLERMLVIAIVLAFVLCTLALLLALVSNAVNRQRLSATLRTLGFSRRQNGALTAWEIGPTVCAGLIGGLAAGLALPFVVVAPLNLAAFTGGTAHPMIAVNGAFIALAVVGFLVVSGVSTVIAMIVSSRRSVASVLRIGEDE